MPIASRVFPVLSCSSFKISGLILRSLMHFELILVQGDKHGPNFNFLQSDIKVSQKHLSKMLPFLHSMFLVPLSKFGGPSYMGLY
jgi:hypothetical protein